MIRLKTLLPLLISLLAINNTACQKSGNDTKFVVIDPSGQIAEKAKNAGFKVTGENILEISGPKEDVSEMLESESSNFMVDEKIELKATKASQVEEHPMYLAKRDFALDTFLAGNPKSDGRGTIVGVIDDGISANQIGFVKTTTGKRKIIRRESKSTDMVVKLSAEKSGSNLIGLLTESPNSESKAFTDLNRNGEKDSYRVSVDKNTAEICIELDPKAGFECLKSFSKSGDFLYWNEDKTKLLTAEFDSSESSVKFFQGEADTKDSHGEGVASVMAGHNIGGKFDGVAPGAQILDYDLSEVSLKQSENDYTIMTFVDALTWMGENGADVVNISYSIFFQSPKSQLFMKEVLSELVDRYKFVITFSAGNDGAALGTMSRGMIYPEASLIVGAYASYDLEEYVHGVTGLPEEGAVIRYSSRGPSADGGTSPSVISPMASLVHHSSGAGYRGFSGTSSAAPAMGGLVATLISHIKQNNMEYDFSALIEAIKISATPLQGAGYVEQGFGLPKAANAIKIYKSMMAAKTFKKTSVSISSIEEPTDVAKGLFLEYDDLKDTEKEYLLKIKAAASDLVSKDISQNMLSQVRLEYNVDWIKGARETHLSLAESKAYLLISAPKEMEVGSYIFGEISIVDTDSGLALAKVPVTLVRSFKASKNKAMFKWNPTLASDTGERAFIDVSSDVQGLNISYDHGDFVSSSYIELFDPQGNVVHKASSTREIFVETKLKGRYQVVMNRRGGTTKAYKPKITVKAVSMDVLSSEILALDGEIKLINKFKSNLYEVSLYNKIEALSTKWKKAAVNEEVVFDYENLEVGKYKFRWSIRRDSFVSRGYDRCRSEIISSEGKVLKAYRGGSGLVIVKVKPEYKSPSLKIRCFNFERTSLKSSDVQSVWKMELLPNELAYKPLATKKIQLEGQGLINDISFGPLETDAETLILKLKNPNDDSPGIILKELKLVK